MNTHEIAEHMPVRLASSVGHSRASRFERTLAKVRVALAGGRLVNVTGDDRRKGGVYEILRTTLPYLRGAGIDVAWIDLPTRPQDRPALEFFHVLAHGRPPSADWSNLLPSRAVEYWRFGRVAAAKLAPQLRPTDLVVLHDTQTAAVARELFRWRERLLWQAHIGTVEWNECVDSYWRTVGPAVETARARIFYRAGFAPSTMRDTSAYASPGVDPSTPKNASLRLEDARAMMLEPPTDWPLRWLSDSHPVMELGQVIGLQLSRWDPLKDMTGALRIFARTAMRFPSFTAMVVGPSAESESERRELSSCLGLWRELPHDVSSRVHVGVIEESGSESHDQVVRVLQSASDIVLQKSLQEGFGLTVTEAMLRGKPVVATAVGGIPLQLRDGHNGVLLAPDVDEELWSHRLNTLVTDADLRNRLGSQARADVLEYHTVDRSVRTLVDGLHNLLAAGPLP